MSGVWYNASGSSNILKNSYINGFLDVSSMFLTRSDASMAGNVYIGGTAGLNVNNSMSMNGVINQLISTPMISNTVYFGGSTMNDSYVGGRLYVEYDISTNSRLFVRDDASFISDVFIGGDLSMNGKLAIGRDASLNSRVFIGSDLSMNGNLSIGSDLSMNGNLAIGGDASLNSRVFIGSDLSMNGNLSVGKDLSITGNLSVKQYSTKLTIYTVNYNNLTVDQDMSLNGRLFLTGDASMIGNVFMARNVGIGKTPEYALDISGGALQTSIGSSSNTYNNEYGKVPPSNVYLSSFSPNSKNATIGTWVNNNITWTATSSSITSTLFSYNAFNTTYSTSSDKWESAGSLYTGGIANSSAALTLNISGQNPQRGEWLQIQSSVPVVMTSYSLASGDAPVRLPKTFWIVGSNNGTNWNVIQTASCGATQYSSTAFTMSSTFLVNSASAQASGSATLTTTTNGSFTTNAYTYFRLIALTMFSTTETLIDISEWTPTFSLQSVSGPSKTLLYMDSSNINQLDVSGSLALVNSNASSMTVIPNSTTATSHSWNNNNITWVANASTTIGTGYSPYQAFNTSVSTPAWASNSSCYNSTTGVYSGTTPAITPTGQSAIQGEWLQLQSSVPLIMNSYILGCVDTPLTYPRTFWIIGSNDGITWNPIHYATTTATSGVYTAGTHTGLFTVTSGSAVNSFTTVTTFSSYSSLPYTYFRLVIIATFPSSASTYTYVGEWTPYFSPVTSSVSMSLDNGVPNQLNIGGGLNVAGPLNVTGVFISSCVYRTTTTVVNTASVVTLALSVVLSNSNFTLSSNKIYVAVSGYYLVNLQLATIAGGAVTAQYTRLALYINGIQSTNPSGVSDVTWVGNNGERKPIIMTGVFYFNSTDEITITCNAGGTGSINIDNSIFSFLKL
jgi:hypothetical protein